MRRKHRHRARGAALVEAAVVIPVMLVFLGLIMFTYRSYAVKIEQQTMLRGSVLSYASHDCESSELVTSVNKDPGVAEAGSSVVEGPAKNFKLGESGVGAFNPSTEKARGTRSAIVRGSAVEDRKRVAFSRGVKTTSIVACNQKSYSSGFWALLDGVGKLAAGGGKGIF